MKFESAFDIGEKGWVFEYDNYPYSGRAVERTVGQIRIVHTDSKGSEYAFGDNYKPQKEETGINGGSVYTLGQHIFKTKEECEAVFAEVIAKSVAEKKAQQKRERKEKLSRESYLRSQLAEIEQIKAEAAE